jgi:hypothetical protein
MQQQQDANEIGQQIEKRLKKVILTTIRTHSDFAENVFSPETSPVVL